MCDVFTSILAEGQGKVQAFLHELCVTGFFAAHVSLG